MLEHAYYSVIAPESGASIIYRDSGKAAQMAENLKITAEDARLCVANGVDGFIVSNHGGRSEDSGLSSIAVLPEIVEAVGGRMPILVDSGFRRGSDIVKALAMGASAVCIGRPYIWGLGAFGQAGVEAVLEIYRRELRAIMRQAGTTSLDKITRDSVIPRPS